MDNRRGIRNWDAFGTLYNFASRMLATELLEPVLKFTFDLSAALLLGVTFIFQSLSVLIAFDVVVLSFYQVTCTYLCGILSALMVFIASERERTATVRALVKYLSNIMWVKIIYTVHPDCWTYMSGGPIMAAALMHTLVGFYTERLNSEQSLLTQVLYSLFLLTLFLIVFNTIYLAPDHILLETVFMLRTPIDTLCNAADTIFKLCDNALGVDNHMPVYTTQIARYSFWSAVHLLQFMLINTTATATSSTTTTLGRRADKYIYFFLFLHDLLELAVPARHLLVQIRNERYITKTFPKLTALELSAVCEETCPVCLSEHTRDTVRLRCNHLLHAGCLHSILRQNADSQQHSRCPMCRADIDIAPPPRAAVGSGPGGLLGSGMRGLRARSTGTRAQVYRTVNNANANTTTNNNNANNTTVQASARGRFGTAEQLIADHLQQHNLQQGDVIHIRIIPRGSRATATAGTNTAANSATNTVASTATNGTTNTGPQPLVPSHLPAPIRTTTTTIDSSNTNNNTNTLHPSPSAVMEAALQECEHTSVLRTIHAHGLHTDSEGSGASTSVSASNSSADVGAVNTVDANTSSAMDIDDTCTNTTSTNTNNTNSADSANNGVSSSQDVVMCNDELDQLLSAASDAIDTMNNATNTDTSTTNSTINTANNVNNTQFDDIDADTVQSAIDNYQPLPLSYVPDTNTTSTTSTNDTTHTMHAYEHTQVDSQHDMQVHIDAYCNQGSNSSNSDSGSDSGDSGESGDDDGEDSSVAGTAHSSDDDECDENESVDLLHHDVAATLTPTISTNDTTTTTNTTTTPTATPTHTTTTTTTTTATSPQGIKRKHSVIDLVSPPESPDKNTPNPGTPERAVNASSVNGSSSASAGREVKMEPAAKVQRVDE